VWRSLCRRSSFALPVKLLAAVCALCPLPVQEAVFIAGTDFGPASEVDNLLSVTFTHATPKPDSLVYVATSCAVNVSHVGILCTTPPGVGAGHVWTVHLGGQSSYASGGAAPPPAGVPISSVSTSYRAPLVRSCDRFPTTSCLSPLVVAARPFAFHGVSVGMGKYLRAVVSLRCRTLPDPRQIKDVEGAGADSAATNGGQVFRVNGDFFGLSHHAAGRLVVSYGPFGAPKYRAGGCPLVLRMLWTLLMEGFSRPLCVLLLCRQRQR
jgi:hypothetical protein